MQRLRRLLSIIAVTTLVLAAMPLTQVKSQSYAALRPSVLVRAASPSTVPGFVSATPEAGCTAADLAVSPQSGDQIDLELLIKLQPAPGQDIDDAALVGIRTVLEHRLELLDVRGDVRRQSDGQIVIRLHDVMDPPRIAEAVTGTMLLEIIDPQGRELQPGALVATTLGAPGDTDSTASGTPVSPGGGSAPVFETIISGHNFTDVYATTSTYTEAKLISFTLDETAAARLLAYTSSHVGQPMSIVLDKRVISSPYISDVISSEGVIEGIPDEEVPVLVAQLKAGALDVPLKLVECRVLPTEG